MYVHLDLALQLLNAGEVVAFPTETVYGLGGRIDNEVALKKIFSIKARPFFDPLIVHVPSIESARSLTTSWPPVYDVLARAFWPGPLTLICDKLDSLSPLITSGLTTVGLRVPRHPLALELLTKVGVGLAAPSANRFGRTSPTSASHVEAEFNGEVAVLDGGPCEVGLESTVLRASLTNAQSNHWRIEILRPGGVSNAEIRNALSQAGLSFDIKRTESVASPGHLKAHYQPTRPVILMKNRKWSDDLLPDIQRRLQLSEALRPVRLELDADPRLAARRLYSQLRQLAEKPNALIIVERKPEQSDESWDAIWDRLERASTLQI